MRLLAQLKDAQKEAMKAKDKPRLGTIRMVLAEIKKKEIDEKIELGDAEITAVLTKAVKQRKDSFAQYTDAGRPELAEIEAAEIAVIEAFLPQALTEEEVEQLVAEAISSTSAAGMQDMGKVMAELKPKITGRADMGKVSGLVRAKLN